MFLPIAVPAFCAPMAAQSTGTVPVHVEGAPGSYRLMRGGKPFFVKGAGAGELAPLLPKYGANAMRSWNIDTGKEDLETCRRAGLMLQMGIWLPRTEEKKDYGDPAVIADLENRVRDAVRIGKDHPNLLAYGLGNEMEWGGREADPTLWRTINRLTRLLHTLDPDHPVVVVIAELPEGKVAAINQYAPDIDVLGVNTYGGAPSVWDRLKAQGWTKPYLVTEFGPLGPWEGGHAPWGAAYEMTSTGKAGRYVEGYQKGVLGAPGQCLGSFAFLWGSKQEETATWFGMFLPDSKTPVETVETMSALWQDRPPPKGRIAGFSLDKNEVAPDGSLTAIFEPTDKDAKIDLTVTIRGETPVKANMGTGELTLPTVSTVTADRRAGLRSIALTAPREPGAYRVYVVARDGSEFAATANVPFRVK